MYFKINSGCISELAKRFFDIGKTDLDAVKETLCRTNDRRNGLNECLLDAMLIAEWNACLDGQY